MSEYKHILFAADFSPVAEVAGKRAVQIAACFGARLTVLHVIDYFPEDLPVECIGPEDKDPAQHLMENSQTRLAALTAGLDFDNIDNQVVFSTHSAAWEIAEYARQQSVDLVVTGSHGRHGLTDILGSTAGSTAHRVTCDLLVVRGQ